MATVALVQSKTATGSSGTAAVTLDTAPTVGETMVAILGTETAITVPAGWVSVQEVVGTKIVLVAWRTVQAGDTGVSFTITSGPWALILTEYAGIEVDQAAMLANVVPTMTTTTAADATTSITFGKSGTADATDSLVIAALTTVSSSTISSAWTEGFTHLGSLGSTSALSLGASWLHGCGHTEFTTSTTMGTARRFVGLMVVLRAVAPVASSVVWSWIGANAATSVQCAAKLDGEKVARLEVAQSPVWAGSTLSAEVTAASADDNVVRLSVSGLTADTRYHWRLRVDGSPTRVGGSFRTSPTEGVPAPFRFVASACGGYRDNASGNQQVPISDAPVWDAIAAHSPLFMLHMGDFHYQDVNTTVRADHTEPYDTLLTSAKQGRLYRDVPIHLMWDDHDYCGNDSNGSAAGGAMAETVRRRYVPSPVTVQETGATHYAFTVGRVRFLMCDNRREAAVKESAGGPTKSRLGLDQRQWVLDELDAADATPDIGLVVLMVGIPWNHEESTGVDGFAAYAHERTILGDAIAAADTAVVILHGDAHMLAADDGSNNAWGGCPILCAGAIGRSGSVKGGGYSFGTFPANTGTFGNVYWGQFAVVDVLDDGDTIQLIFSGRRVWRWGLQDERMSARFSFAAPSS
jgi:hypothetical protein